MVSHWSDRESNEAVIGSCFNITLPSSFTAQAIGSVPHADAELTDSRA